MAVRFGERFDPLDEASDPHGDAFDFQKREDSRKRTRSASAVSGWKLVHLAFRRPCPGRAS